MTYTRHTTKEELDPNLRGGYQYRRYVDHRDGAAPFNVLQIDVDGEHGARRVLAGIRNYFVVAGKGEFTVEEESILVRPGDLITIGPQEVYSYEGKMELLEFNIDTGDGINHEDI